MTFEEKLKDRYPKSDNPEVECLRQHTRSAAEWGYATAKSERSLSEVASDYRKKHASNDERSSTKTDQVRKAIMDMDGKETRAASEKMDDDYDPTPCCYQHGAGAIGTNEPCPEIADND